VRRSADRVKDRRDSTAAGVFANGVAHVLEVAVDDVVRSGGTHTVYALAAGDADDIDAAIGQNRHQHASDGAGGAPHYGCASLERPDAGEAARGESGDCHAGSVFEREASGMGASIDDCVVRNVAQDPRTAPQHTREPTVRV